MNDPSRTSRRFERALNTDVNASRQDHMNLEELARHNPDEAQEILDLFEGAVLIATMVYKPEEKKVECIYYHR